MVVSGVLTQRKSAVAPSAERGWDAHAKELLYLQIDCPYRFIRQVELGGAVPFGRRSCPAGRQELGPQISCRSLVDGIHLGWIVCASRHKNALLSGVWST